MLYHLFFEALSAVNRQRVVYQLAKLRQYQFLMQLSLAHRQDTPSTRFPSSSQPLSPSSRVSSRSDRDAPNSSTNRLYGKCKMAKKSEQKGQHEHQSRADHRAIPRENSHDKKNAFVKSYPNPRRLNSREQSPYNALASSKKDSPEQRIMQRNNKVQLTERDAFVERKAQKPPSPVREQKQENSTHLLLQDKLHQKAEAYDEPNWQALLDLFAQPHFTVEDKKQLTFHFLTFEVERRVGSLGKVSEEDKHNFEMQQMIQIFSDFKAKFKTEQEQGRLHGCYERVALDINQYLISYLFDKSQGNNTHIKITENDVVKRILSLDLQKEEVVIPEKMPSSRKKEGQDEKPSSARRRGSPEIVFLQRDGKNRDYQEQTVKKTIPPANQLSSFKISKRLSTSSSLTNCSSAKENRRNIPNLEYPLKRDPPMFINYDVKWVWFQNSSQKTPFLSEISPEKHRFESTMHTPLQELRDQLILDLQIRYPSIKKTANIDYSPFIRSSPRNFDLHFTVNQVIFNLPQGYSFKAKSRKDFVFDQLSIQNNFGMVQWLEEVDLQGVDFSSALFIGDKIFHIDDPELEKPCEVVLRGLPGSLLTGSQDMFEAYSKNVEKMGATLLEVDPEQNFFRIKVDTF